MKLGREDLLMTFAMVSSRKSIIISEGVRLTDFRLVVGRLQRSTYWVRPTTRIGLLSSC